MRAYIRIIIVSLVLFAFPNAAADDPNLSLPDTDEPTAEALTAADAQRAGTTNFTRAAFFETSQFVNEVQRNQFPAGRLVNTSRAAGDYGEATVIRTGALSLTGLIWTGETFWTKVGEGQAFGAAGDQTVAAGIAAGHVIALATFQVVCAESLDPSSCEDGSIVRAAQDEVDRALGRGGDEAEKAPDESLQASRAAAGELVSAVVPLP